MNDLNGLVGRERLRAELKARDRRKRPPNAQMVAALRSAGLLQGQWREAAEPARPKAVKFQRGR